MPSSGVKKKQKLNINGDEPTDDGWGEDIEFIGSLILAALSPPRAHPRYFLLGCGEFGFQRGGLGRCFYF